ncbi:MAG: DUF3795 domain-containing protein [Acidobacteriota bacterium]|jgi:hypothetical protein|nr:DUF3795 domain-containing protein [Acidobacteriota bacterium]
MITRRKFVCGVACCAAVAGKLTGQEAGGPKNENPDAVFKMVLSPIEEAGATKNENLITPCGTYCGACSMYRATHDTNVRNKMASKSGAGAAQTMQCDGCLGGGRLPSHVPKCAIKECAASKSKTLRCSDCAEFPCSRITDFNNDGVQHHAIVLGNLRRLREIGIKDWAKEEEDRWRCPKCETMFSWYDQECVSCKTPRSEKLFPLRKAKT